MKKYLLASGMVIAFAIALYSCSRPREAAPESFDSAAVEDVPVVADSAANYDEGVDAAAADTTGVHAGPKTSGPKPK